MFYLLILLRSKMMKQTEYQSAELIVCNAFLKDFPLRIAELKEEAEWTNPEDILEIYCIFGANPQTKAFMDQIRKVQNLVYNNILTNKDFDYQAFIL